MKQHVQLKTFRSRPYAYSPSCRRYLLTRGSINLGISTIFRYFLSTNGTGCGIGSCVHDIDEIANMTSVHKVKCYCSHCFQHIEAETNLPPIRRRHVKFFSLMKMFEFCLRFDWSLFLRLKWTVFQHWFRWWLGANQATSHNLIQWWYSLLAHKWVTRPQWIKMPNCVEYIQRYLPSHWRRYICPW